jgi:hypothetical protein
MSEITRIPAANVMVSVEPIPAGVVLDLEGFVRVIVHSVVERLVQDDDMADRLGQLGEQAAGDPYTVVRELPFEQLVDDLVSVAGTRLPVYGERCLQLAERIESTARASLGLPAAASGEGRSAA